MLLRVVALPGADRNRGCSPPPHRGSAPPPKAFGPCSVLRSLSGLVASTAKVDGCGMSGGATPVGPSVWLTGVGRGPGLR